MALLLLRRALGDEGQRAAGLESTLRDVRERRKPLLARRCLELVDGDELALEIVALESPSTHEHVGLSLERLELACSIESADDRPVDDEQRGGTDDSADQRVVIADD